MSAGEFTNSFYETDEGNIVPIKLQPETLTINFGSTPNAAGGTAAEVGFPSAQVSQSKRALGINARSVSVKITAAATGYKDGTLIRVPVPKLSVYQGITKFSAVTCPAGTGEVVGFSPEKIN